jgi:hypothetical protein
MAEQQRKPRQPAKVERGYVVGVPSGDSLVVVNLDSKDLSQVELTLQGIQAPRLGIHVPSNPSKDREDAVRFFSSKYLLCHFQIVFNFLPLRDTSSLPSLVALFYPVAHSSVFHHFSSGHGPLVSSCAAS